MRGRASPFFDARCSGDATVSVRDAFAAVRQKWINADRLLSSKMITDRVIRQWLEHSGFAGNLLSLFWSRDMDGTLVHNASR